MDPFQHFKEAQERVYPQVLAELRAGKKRSHWIWFIFPQIAGLGRSPVNQRYALSSVAQARQYLADPLLHARLLECCALLLGHQDLSITEILGYPDDLKLRSSMTLFLLADPDEVVFQQVLDTFYSGRTDARTIALGCA